MNNIKIVTILILFIINLTYSGDTTNSSNIPILNKSYSNVNNIENAPIAKAIKSLGVVLLGLVLYKSIKYLFNKNNKFTDDDLKSITEQFNTHINNYKNCAKDEKAMEDVKNFDILFPPFSPEKISLFYDPDANIKEFYQVLIQNQPIEFFSENIYNKLKTYPNYQNLPQKMKTILKLHISRILQEKDKYYDIKNIINEYISADKIDLKNICCDCYKDKFEDYKDKIKMQKFLIDFELQSNYLDGDQNIIVHGPSGTGKTTLIKSLVKTIILNDTNKVYYKQIRPDDLNGTYQNESVIKIKKLRENIEQFYTIIAHERNPDKEIIFILQLDEIESYAPSRDQNLGSRAVSVIGDTNAFINMIDDFKSKKKYHVFVMGTSNNLKFIDNAAIRAGRFNNIWELGYPNDTTKLSILEYYLQEYNTSTKAIINLTDDIKKSIIQDNKTPIEIQRGLEQKINECINKLKSSGKSLDRTQYNEQNKLMMNIE
jgi:AAA+ superfamily predicted ATPase